MLTVRSICMRVAALTPSSSIRVAMDISAEDRGPIENRMRLEFPQHSF